MGEAWGTARAKPNQSRQNPEDDMDQKRLQAQPRPAVGVAARYEAADNTARTRSPRR
jgi:hypothetical protein